VYLRVFKEFVNIRKDSVRQSHVWLDRFEGTGDKLAHWPEPLCQQDLAVRHLMPCWPQTTPQQGPKCVYASTRISSNDREKKDILSALIFEDEEHLN
jgi:hypothetical protein